jgi:cytochrome bd-type quinol oxidase subunit 2
MLGVCVAGLLSVMLAALKLTVAGQWSWWRVLLPLEVFVGHNLCYLVVGLIWLSLTDDGEATVREKDWFNAFLWLALICFLVFADNVVSCIEGSRHPDQWLRFGGWPLISVSLALSLLFDLWFWCTTVGGHDEQPRES